MTNIFKDLFVLELANNHWGKLARGLKIIDEFSHVIRFNNVKAAIKLQFRDVDNFIHKDFRDRTDIRYENVGGRLCNHGFSREKRGLFDHVHAV